MVKNISKKLITLTKEVFFDYVLPRIQEKYPESTNKFFVNITSSVAYGIADKHSDTDIFILFKHHEDYLRFHKKFDKLIQAIKFPEKFQRVCDKGMRFEFESLRKSDVLDLYTVQSYGNWIKQTEWLLCWLVNSLTIYDPADLITSFKKKIKFFDKDVLETKVNLSFILLLKYQKMLALLDLSKNPFLLDFYFFKATKRLMDLVYWRAGKYTPHPKWQYFILQFIGSYGKKLYYDLGRVLYSKNQERLKLIKKWSDFLGEYWYNSKILDTDLYSFYKNEYNFDVQTSKNLEITFFKDYSTPLKDKTKIFSLIKSLSFKDNFFLNEETGISYLGKYDYDSVMRLQDKYLDIDLTKIGPGVHKRRINYLHFIIWRKIRVIQSALKRGNRFNQLWYSNQVVEHIVEMAFRLKKKKLPAESNQLSSLESYGTFPKIYSLLKSSFKVDIEERITIFWKCFFILQNYIKKNKILSKFQIDNPLIIQFDIEYWRYENLRL